MAAVNRCVGADIGAKRRTREGMPMSAMAILLNLLWIAFGGLWMATTIIGLPWARAAFNIAVYTLLPFGQKAVSRADYLGRDDIGTGPLGFIGNVVWFVLA